ncbi:MAG: hypothetical protein KDA27_09235 [Candidatus Eisenbacteria bacterium]|uniref:Porin n=1 Tax=Eiseniibacteriota bacterium TaxID=2212470 RepID=A0A956NB78_UNCEI|nr:hypothetical protein [Candidatus Eisenbacteria bacterium]
MAAHRVALTLAVGVPLGLLAAGSSPTPVLSHPRVAIYGDVLYSRFDYGPDQRSGEFGAPDDSRATFDVPFFVVEVEHEFRDDLELEVEVEVEHGGTGSALELEYEEFGEYEVEVEKGGEVVIEQIHLTKSWSRAWNLRAGRFITAVGLLNRSHEPTDFLTTIRTEAEVSLIPTTWNETGIELFGRAGRFSYRAQVVNGLDSTGFDSKYFIVGGAQTRFEDVRATDLALVGRIDVAATRDVSVGGSAYWGNTTGNRPKPDMEGIDAHLTLFDAHAQIARGPYHVRALYLRGDLENADLVSAKNGRLSSNLQVPRTPVAESAFGWYVEVGYDIAPLVGSEGDWRLLPFVQLSGYDSMAEVPDGTFDVPRFDRSLLTVGAAYFPHENVVLKADWSHRTFGDDRINDEDTIRFDLGFKAELFREDSDPARHSTR